MREPNPDSVCRRCCFASLPSSAIVRSAQQAAHVQPGEQECAGVAGNFKTLEQAIRDFSADGVRVALAAAGDAMADANFEYDVADKAVLRLTKELAWVDKELWPALDSLRTGPLEFLDRVFANELSIAAHDTHKVVPDMLPVVPAT